MTDGDIIDLLDRTNPEDREAIIRRLAATDDTLILIDPKPGDDFARGYMWAETKLYSYQAEVTACLIPGLGRKDPNAPFHQNRVYFRTLYPAKVEGRDTELYDEVLG